jgi:hypothetical protein
VSEASDKLLLKYAELKTQFFGAYHRNVDRNRKYYNLDYQKDVVPEGSGIKVRILPTARRAIDEPADHILHNPRIYIPVRPTEGDRQKEQDTAEAKRKFANAWWSEVTKRFNPIGDGKKPFLNEGKIAIRKTLRMDMLPDKPTRDDHPGDDSFKRATDSYRNKIASLGRDEFMWDVQLLDNTTIFEDPSNHRDPKYVYIAYDILCEEAKYRWPDKAHLWASPEYNDFDKLEYKEYWSKPVKNAEKDEPGRFVQWVQEDLVHEDDNPYPYIPVVIEDPGFGANHMLAKPEEKFVGMTEHAFEVFQMESIQTSSIQAVTEITAFPMVKTRNMDASKKLIVGPGKVIPLEGAEDDPQREDFDVVEWPDIPASVTRMLEKTDRVANSTFKMDILGGIPMSGVETATEADQNVRNATSKLAGPVSGLERLVERLTEQVFSDIEDVIGAPVTIFAAVDNRDGEVRLKPEDLHGFKRVRAELSTSDEDAISQVKARFWMEAALRNPFLSYTTAMERGNISDEPQMEMTKRASEDVFLSEEFRKIRVMTAAQVFGELANLMQQMGIQADTPGSGVNTSNTLFDAAAAGGAASSGQPALTPSGDELFEQATRVRNTNLGGSQLR